MPDLFRGITRIQDADDFAGSLTNDYYLKYSSGTGKFSLQPLSVSPGGSSGQVQYNNAGSFDGAAALTYATSGSLVTVMAQTSTDKPLIVKGAASQSANLQEWQNSSGTVLTYITSAGRLSGATGSYFQPFSGSGGSVGLFMYPPHTNGIGVVVRGLTSQTGNLQEWQNSSGAILASITSSGSLLLTAATTSTTPFTARGIASQTEALVQLQGQSSTTAGTAQAEVDTAWVDSTHATRKARLLLRVYDTAVREGLRIDADGTYALTAIGGGTVTASTSLTVTSPTATYIGQIVKGASAQSANLTEWQNSSGTALATVNKDGWIGVGTSPSYNLHVSHATSAIASVVSGTRNFRMEAYYNDLVYLYSSGSGFVVGTSDSNPLDFYTNNLSRIKITSDGNLALFGNGSFGSGDKVVSIANATTVPTTDPTGGGILYCEGGALKFRGSSGTVTTVAPA